MKIERVGVCLHIEAAGERDNYCNELSWEVLHGTTDVAKIESGKGGDGVTLTKEDVGSCEVIDIAAISYDLLMAEQEAIVKIHDDADRTYIKLGEHLSKGN